MGKRGIPFPAQVAIAVGVGAFGTLAVARTHIPLPDVSSFVASAGDFRAAAHQSGCNIKGNISVDTGERIYHVPGQKYYDVTIISPQKGERWFCTEAEARAAGWRRSKI